MGLGASFQVLYAILAYSTCRYFVKLGPHIFSKLCGVFYVLFHLNGEEEERKKTTIKFDFIISQMEHFNFPFLNHILR